MCSSSGTANGDLPIWTIMKKIFITLLFFAVNGGGLLAQEDSQKPAQQIDAASPTQDARNPEKAVFSWQQEPPQTACPGNKSDSPLSAHKLNYFSINKWLGDSNSQAKFQISMKFRLLEPNLYFLKYNLFPAYAAYTQKSLWNVGQGSMPFEETNYNPELFLDYPVNAAILGTFKLRNLVVGLIEHESNGVAGAQSRSWNRQYVLINFGLEQKERLAVTNSFIPDRALLYVKLWHASGYSDQDAYLQSIGSGAGFLDYMGRGEIGISVRNFIWGGFLKDHQLDIKTPIFRDIGKPSYEVQFRQMIPGMYFAIYLQYWYGYGETLLRFNQFGHRGFAGLSFSY